MAAELFGVEGTAVDLGSERDQTFLIDDGAGAGGVIKISTLGEDPAVLDLEAEATRPVSRVDPAGPGAQPGPAVAARGAASYRPTVEGSDGMHFVRLFDRMHGRVGGAELDDGAVRDFGATNARLNLPLRGFFHPAAGRSSAGARCGAGWRRPPASISPCAASSILRRAVSSSGIPSAPRNCGRC